MNNNILIFKYRQKWRYFICKKLKEKEREKRKQKEKNQKKDKRNKDKKIKNKETCIFNIIILLLCIF